MFKSNNNIVLNKVRIGWHFHRINTKNREAYSALKSKYISELLQLHPTI